MLITFLASNTRREWQLSPNDLLWVESEENSIPDYLAVIESITFEPSPSFGEGVRVSLRAVNDDLNPFAYMLHL